MLASQAALSAVPNLPASAVNTVHIGNVLSCSGVDTPYIARHVALRTGLDVGTPALVVNRLCGSGFQVENRSLLKKGDRLQTNL